MDKTEAQVHRLLIALTAPGYDLGVLSKTGMYRLESVPALRILRMLPYLKYRNLNGAHIYIRPTGESAYTLLDDLTTASVARLTAEGFGPAAVVETSPGNFQAWIKHAQPLPKELGTLAAKLLAEQFDADLSAADWRRFGRVPGFTNRKIRHCNAQGLYPFSRVHSGTGLTFTAAEAFHKRLLEIERTLELERCQYRSRFRTYPMSQKISLSRFRALPRYASRPAAADMAFSIAACAHGWTEWDIATALRKDYLSRDSNKARQIAYIRRTIRKARQWAA